MYHDVELIKAVMLDRHLTLFAFYDANRKDQLAFGDRETANDAVALMVQYLSTLHGPVRLEAWAKDGFRAAGGRATAAKETCSWLVKGTASATDPAPQQVIYQDRRDAAQPAPDLDLRIELETLKVQMAYDKKLAEVVAGLQPLPDEDDDDDEDEDEDEDEPETKPSELVGLLREFLPLFLNRSAPIAAPITGTAKPGAGAISSDVELLAAMDRMAANDPESVADYRAKILALYGTPKE